LPTTFLFSFLHSYLHPPHVHSFPTRRSYDLAWLGSQDVIAASRGLKQLEQLSWGIGHVGLPGARQQLPIVEFYVPVEPKRIAILGFVANYAIGFCQQRPPRGSSYDDAVPFPLPVRAMRRQ